jgi:predicted lipoprotein with Yx(FWY)xxD motif
MSRQHSARHVIVRSVGSGAALAAAALLLTACGSSSGGGKASTVGAQAPAVKATGTLAVASTDAGKVLVDPQGRTLYAFAADTKGHSACTGSCATYWPPTPAGSLPGSTPKGVTATLGQITRPDGTMQLTVDGFPMYTYVGDAKPGQAKGQGLNESGGLWWVVSGSGKWVKDAKPSSSATTDGGGYGY